ncbi:tetratricopeptide repeat protein [candidate division TA06 bacterium]|nr:tetratricopeptide repeat protein [candidate division TA06 bacterium]
MERWSTFIIVSSLRPLDFSELNVQGVSWERLDASQLAQLEERSKELVLTDDYAPVENFLTSVVRQRGDWFNRHRLSQKLTLKTIHLMELGRFEEAIVYNRKFLERDSVLAQEAHYNIAKLLAKQGKLDEAMVEYREVLRLNPTSALSHIGFGHALFRRGRLDEAGEHYEEALRAAPDSVEAHAGMGSVFFQKGQFGRAIRSYREALRLDPQNVMMHNNVGSALMQQGNLQEAIEHFKKALSIDPTFVLAQQGMEMARELQRRETREREAESAR